MKKKWPNECCTKIILMTVKSIYLQLGEFEYVNAEVTIKHCAAKNRMEIKSLQKLSRNKQCSELKFCGNYKFEGTKTQTSSL